ncbi:hypothetical protein A3Q56_04064 [Intoshia linei]|uniref:Uncharacterized protein n=1 Tax=Intoshia linei TaxID=1819745 RepID=A0A177B1P7_9BILA|nr:hypothetical protein A3Q56_04064 [Intoshia linei]
MEMNCIASNNVEKWKVLRDLLNKNDFKILIEKKIVDETLKPDQAIQMLIDDSVPEFTFRNEIKFFNTSQNKFVTIIQFGDRLCEMGSLTQ